MRHLVFVYLVISSVLIFFGCQEENALSPDLGQSDEGANFLAKPSPNLIGTAVAYFDISRFPYLWEGTIDFGEGHEMYGLRFKTLGELRLYSQASPFEERFEIYKLGDVNEVYLEGWNTGVVSLANNPPDDTKFRANGKIEIANYPLHEWLGRNVHISGVVTWTTDGSGFPETALSTFRIN